MEAEIWQRLPEELLYMILARLSMRVLGKMRTVCKKWNSLLSSCDALQVAVPNWSLHSTPGFLLQITWDLDLESDDVEYWVIEAHGSEMYKLPLTHQNLVGTCKGIICIRGEENISALSIGIPGTRNWKQLPPPPFYWHSRFRGLAFDCSTRRFTVVLGNYEYYRRQHDNNRIGMSIYDSESSAWTEVSTMVTNHINPSGKGVYWKGKFYWVSEESPGSVDIYRWLVVAFNIADGVWTEIPLPQECKYITSPSIGECYGQLLLVDCAQYALLFGSVSMWKLNEAQVWCHLRTFRLADSIVYRSLTINSSGLIMVMDPEMNISMYNWKGKLINREIRFPGLRTSRPPLVDISSFESNNLWWPETSFL